MTLFLTSSLRSEDGSALNPANGFVDALRSRLPQEIKLLYICSDPDAHELTDSYAREIFPCFLRAGFRLAKSTVLDSRNHSSAADLVREADCILLAGGHVPTQNAFFCSIGLAELLSDYPGVIVGTSAGSMNCARIVYSHPEAPGEAISPDYKRFFEGLGLTEINIIPHLTELRETVIDGLRAIEEIAIPDSIGREFLALPDGSYVLIERGKEGKSTAEVCGEAFRIADGKMSPYRGNDCSG